MKYIQFKKEIKSPIFTLQEIRLKGIKIFAYQLTLWKKHGYISKLKNGIYIFTDNAGDFTAEELARVMYSPSYVSMEKALSFYGLIPELVYSITSVTPKITRRFKNQFADYKFYHIKPQLFFGYAQKKGAYSAYFIADPEKALLDFFYLNKIKTKEDLNACRINWDELKKIADTKKLKSYAKRYNNKRITFMISQVLERI